ncbi:hypothetical protein BD309DRAFT_970384 [Dichomitus squalens]|uniref:Probable RNA polymerase II nuclear localization protein SLC7A6OS n=1 Tax=Dichomitus squalens TaxID=114155 RepID=A0A4Q9PSI3_9APHY|nr:hypothetical protein BD309DRAFT_970384 [Dichomitus squalens]TBU57382.1 hypothetical protein BD310DRAFT_929603 [Dichomitus squalens]
MEVDPPHALQPQQPYAIVRIKRKRNEEPLDALVVDAAPTRKKSKGGLNVFQYAGTVEQAEWNDEKQKKELEKHLAEIARESAQRKREEATVVLPSAVAPSVPVVQQPPPANASSPITYPVPAPSLKRPPYQAPSRTYTIVQQEQPAQEPYPRRRQGNAPPKVWSSKELDAAKRAAQVKMYDAVPSTSTGKQAGAPSEVDVEIDKFLPLLKDYLNVSELTPPAPGMPVKGDGMDEDYVYDVFYHRPTTAKELYDPASSSNIAKLTGLPPELSGLSGEDSSDEEDSDEDDEDSNAEDWYTNDYPEEEESDRENEEDLSDELHEHSDYDEAVHERSSTAYRDVMSDDF